MNTADDTDHEGTRGREPAFQAAANQVGRTTDYGTGRKIAKRDSHRIVSAVRPDNRVKPPGHILRCRSSGRMHLVLEVVKEVDHMPAVFVYV